MDTDFDVDYGTSRLYEEEYEPIWKNEYMQAMRDNIITAHYIKRGSSCNIKRLKKKIALDNNLIDYIGSGAYAKAYMIDHHNDDRYPDNVYVLKNTTYEHDEDVNDLGDNVNTEIRMIRLLNNFIFDGIAPHVLLYIKHARCTSCTRPSMRLVTEVCKSNMDELSSEKWPHIKNIDVAIFQVMFMLNAIHTFYPEWRHNDLRTDNVFLDKVEYKDYYYHVDGKYYKLSTNMFAKISDFGHSNLPGIIDNNLVNTQEEYDWYPEDYGMRPTENKYYDMHTLLNSINITYIDDDANSTLDENMQNLLNEFLPKEYRTGFKVTTTRIKRRHNENIAKNDCLIPDIEPFQPKDTFKYFKHFEVSVESIPQEAHIFSATSLKQHQNN